MTRPDDARPKDARPAPLMSIGEAAAASGVPAKTIRYYEEIGLLAPKRGANGYRAFSGGDVRRLAFIGRARSLGFSIEDCRALASLYADRRRASADVKRIAEDHIARIGARIAALETMRSSLQDLSRRCHGDDRPDCPILEELASDGPGESARDA